MLVRCQKQMTMKNKKQSKPTENLYIQVWRNPIFCKGLLAILSPTDWHTLTALAMFMDDKGQCYPSLKRLGPILGLENISSISRRVKALENKAFQGNPVVMVKRKKKQAKKGNWIFDNNHYYLNPEIVSIFNSHPTTLISRRLQMKEFQKIRQGLANSLSMNPK